MAIALCPGSFDPPTNGHVDVVERASRHFDRVIVSVVTNPAKKSLFDAKERVALLTEVLSHLPNVEVTSNDGLLVELARVKGADVIVKGLRALSDVEYELQMAQMNTNLYDAVDTMFIITNPKWSFISSSLVKEVAALGGDVSRFVPKAVNAALVGREKSG